MSQLLLHTCFCGCLSKLLNKQIVSFLLVTQGDCSRNWTVIGIDVLMGWIIWKEKKNEKQLRDLHRSEDDESGSCALCFTVHPAANALHPDWTLLDQSMPWSHLQDNRAEEERKRECIWRDCICPYFSSTGVCVGATEWSLGLSFC